MHIWYVKALPAARCLRLGEDAMGAERQAYRATGVSRTITFDDINTVSAGVRPW
jgi:hypothetical protein